MNSSVSIPAPASDLYSVSDRLLRTPLVLKLIQCNGRVRWPYLWVGDVVGARHSGTQLLSHPPGQQTVDGPVPRSPSPAVDEHHQGNRLVPGHPGPLGAVVQVHLVASAPEGDALWVG